MPSPKISSLGVFHTSALGADFGNSAEEVGLKRVIFINVECKTIQIARLCTPAENSSNTLQRHIHDQALDHNEGHNLIGIGILRHRSRNEVPCTRPHLSNH